MAEVKTENLMHLIHRQATSASISRLHVTCKEVLAALSIALAAGVQDGKTVARWASGEVTEIRDISRLSKPACALPSRGSANCYCSRNRHKLSKPVY
ncbi:MAG: hypothetical protein R2848_00370 [Thermomicrobiales bacterium]